MMCHWQNAPQCRWPIRDLDFGKVLATSCAINLSKLSAPIAESPGRQVVLAAKLFNRQAAFLVSHNEPAHLLGHSFL